MKKAIFNLFLVLIGAIAILFMGEIVARIFCHNQRSIHIPDQIFHHVHNTHFRGHWVSPKGEYNVMVKLNSYGFRDYEYNFKKPKNTTRIIVLGDSFVDALEVDLEETFVKRLEKRLNENSHIQSRYEVINLGTGGYSPVLEYLVLKNIGLKFNPDLVVGCFDFTDISDDSIYSQMMVSDEDGLPLRVTPVEYPSLRRGYFFGKNFLRAYSRLYVLARSQCHDMLIKMRLRKNFPRVSPFVLDYVAQRAISKSVGINPYAVFKPEYSAEDEMAWELTYRFLRGIKSLADISNSKLLLVAIPASDQVASYEVKEGKKVWLREENSFISSTKMQDCLIKFCQENGIGVLDLLPALRRASLPEKPLFFSYDGHFNNMGHKIVAEAIYKYLIINKLFSP